MIYKFRAWDKLFKTWICVGYSTFGEVTLFRMVEDYLAQNKGEATSMLERLGDVEETMFTGKHDINGKELFEGDIVRTKRVDFDFEAGERTYKEYVGTIVYRDHGFWVDAESFGWEGEDLWDWEDLELIGNKYQP